MSKVSIKYGNDEQRLAMSTASRAKCTSFKKRIEAINNIGKSKFSIDEDKGYSIYQQHHLSESVNKIISKAKEIISNSDMDNGYRSNKQFIKINFFSAKELDINSPFVQLATNSDVVATVANYLGHVPLLYDIKMWYSRNIDKKYESSQLFHCDWTDIKNVKLFINVSDIGEDDGPLTVIPANISYNIRKDINYTFGPDKYYLQDDTIEKYYPVNNAIKICGPSGTLSFVDTCRCFHFGSRVKEHRNRVVLAIQYVSPAALDIPAENVKITPFSHLTKSDNLSEVDKMLFG